MARIKFVLNERHNAFDEATKMAKSSQIASEASKL
jgi:hypothetical protein